MQTIRLDIQTSLWKHTGADLNARHSDGNSPLMVAALSGNTRVVELLAGRGAQIGLRKNEFKNALMLAREQGHSEIVEFLEQYMPSRIEGMVSGKDGAPRSSGSETQPSGAGD